MNLTAVRVLLVEDNPAERRLLQEFFKDITATQFELTCCDRLNPALSHLGETVFDAVLLDLHLPDSVGLTSITRIMEVAPTVAIVVLTNMNDDDTALEAMRRGAQDYLMKRQINADAIARSLRYAIERKQNSEALRQARDELSLRVRERTQELEQANQQLTIEIDQRRQAEQTLMRERELAQTTLKSIADGVIATDETGKIWIFNAVAEQLTGWSARDAIGQLIEDVLIIKEENCGTAISWHSLLQRHEYLEGTSLVLQQRQTQMEASVEFSISHIFSSMGESLGLITICRDVTQSRRLSRHLSWQASHDTLTGTINRWEFERQLDVLLTESQFNQRSNVLCFIDLDHFKIVNDTCGHAAGDALLCHVTATIEATIRKNDTLARLGGDEFGILLRDCHLEDGRQVAQKILDALHASRFDWSGRTFSIAASVGITPIYPHLAKRDQLLQLADMAMYEAKQRGRSRVYVHDSLDCLEQVQCTSNWVDRIVQALEQDQFMLFVQPIVPIREPQTRNHYEILLRLRDEANNIISPGQFLPAAERYDLMPLIDRWVITHLFRWLERFAADYATKPRSIFTINLSGASFNDENFLDFIQSQFWQHHIPPSAICFEITETVAIANLQQAKQFIQQLQELGCGFALDDFGSGMSSLRYLKILPVDYLKIDGHFIKNITTDPVDAATVQAIHQISTALGLKTVAEFVEDTATLKKLNEIGIDYAQGYAIAKPQPLDSLFEVAPISTASRWA